MSHTTEVIFVNTLEVTPEKQAELIALLQEGTEQVISKRAGFISVTLLASREGRRVVNIAKWASVDAIKATQADPAAAEFAKRTAAIATAVPGIYDVVAEYHA